MPRGHMAPDGTSEKYCVGQFPEGCGGPTMDHLQSLNRALIACMEAAWEFCGHKAGVPFHYDHDLPGLTHSEAANLQKLRYFGLIEKHFDEHGKQVSGMWKITPKGVGFMRGALYCYPRVWTWRNEVIEQVGEPIDIDHARKIATWTKEDYAEQARAHDFDEDDPEEPTQED